MYTCVKGVHTAIATDKHIALGYTFASLSQRSDHAFEHKIVQSLQDQEGICAISAAVIVGAKN